MEALEQHTGWKALYTIATLPLATVDATQLGELLDTQLRPLFGADMVRLYVADAALSNALRPWVGTEAARAAVLPLGGLPARARQELEARRCFSAVLLDPLILPGDPDAAALHALALAPVTDEAQLLGAVLVGRYVAQPFTVEQTALLTPLAARLAEVLLRQQMATDMHQAQRRTAALYQLGRAWAEVHDIEEMLQAMADGVAETLSAYRVTIATYDLAEKRVLHYIGGGPGGEVLTPVPFEELWNGLAGWVLRERRPALSLKGVTDSRESSAVQQRRRDTQIGSVAVAPLLYQGEIFGTMTALNRVEQPDFTEADVELIVALANQASAALQNVRLTESVEAERGRLATLYEVSRQLAAKTDLEDLAQVALDMAPYVGAQHGDLIIFDVGDGQPLFRSTVQLRTELDAQATARFVQKLRTEGLQGWVLEERKSALIQDTQDDARWLVLETEEGAEAIRSAICAPLFDRQGAIMGTLSYLHERPGALGVAEERLTNEIASRVAVALEGATLFIERERRIAELSILNEIGQALAGSLDLDDLLTLIHQQVGRLFDVTSFYIALYEQGASYWTAALYYEHGERIPPVTYKLGEGLTSHIIHTRRSILLRTQKELLEFHRQRNIDLVGDVSKSWLGVPLLVADEIVGVMAIQNYEAEHVYDEQAQRLLMTIATQGAVAIQNARFFEDVQRSARELSVINEMARDVAVQRDVNAVAELLHRYTARLMDAANFYVTLYYPERNELHFVLNVVEGEVFVRPAGGVRPLGSGLTEHVIQSRKSLLISRDLDEARSKLGIAQMGKSGGKSWLGVPLMVGERVIGVMAVQSYTTPGAYVERHKELLEAIASQAAIALENARLFVQTERSLSETEILYRVSEGLGRAQTFDEILRVISDLTAFVNMQGVTLRVVRDWDVEGFPLQADVYAIQDSEHPETLSVVEGTPVARSEHLLRMLNDPGYILVYHDAEAPEADMSDTVRENLLSRGLRSAVMLGARARGRLVGFLSFYGDRPLSELPERSTQVLRAISDQLAVALDRQQLQLQRQEALDDLANRALRLQTAAEVSRAASSILDPDEILPQVVELIRERFDLYYAGIFLVEETGRWAELRSGTGEAGQQMLARQHRLEVGGTSMIGACVVDGEARIALDVGEEAVRFDNPFLPETRSEMALPLRARGETIGAMTIQDRRPEAFSEADIAILQTMADQIANVIVNARLFTEAQQRFAELQALQRSYTSDAWSEYTAQEEVLGYVYDLNELEPLTADAWDGVLPALASHDVQVQVGGEGERTALIAPITLQEEPIGLLEFEDPEDLHDWSEDDIALVTAVREQLALALQNRMLFSQTQDALAEASALYEIGAHINEARAAEEVLQVTAGGLGRRPEPDRVLIGVLEPVDNPDTLRIVTTWDRKEGSNGGGSYPLEPWQDILDALTQQARLVVPDIEDSTIIKGVVRDVYHRIGVRGVAALALNVQEQRYGIALIYTRTPHEFSTEELRFYETVVQQASVALENIHLVATTRAEAERRAILNEVLQTASRSLDIYQMLRDVGGVISHRFEMPTLFWLWQGERVELVTVHDEAGRAVTLRGNRSFTPKDMPGLTRVIGKSEPSLVKNLTLIQKHNRLEQLCQDLALRELFVVPMISRDQVLGVLMLGRQEGHPPIDADEMGFAQQAAINVGVAAENATLYQEAKSADRLKSEFLANMSHELRTPLNSIIGFSRVILKGIDGPLTDMQRTDLEAIHDSGRHLLNLINDVLDLSKIEAGKMEFIFEPVDVNTVVKGVLSTALALVKDKPVELQRDVEDGLPNIIADERRIRQVVLNLVGNASKFTEEGYIKVSAWREGREVIIAVQDSGIGIPKERYGAVFKEFEQVDSSSTRSYGGTGLGLPVSKKFVEAHGGRIWFESEVGMGTTFFVALPIGGPKAEEPEEEEAKARAEESLTVLTVDDDEGVVTLFRRYLEKQGYHVVGLTKGERVLEEVKRLKPYAVTLDIIMPTKDGWEIIRELKSDPETRDVPIVVCSIISEADKGLSMGVADYLVKPILERDLLDALARLEQQIPSNVLVVDDNPDDRKLLRRYLEEAGYSVEEAPDGAAAISKIHDWLPDLVVLDLMMPEVDGFAVIENLKSSAVTSKIPVVVVTAKELTADERALLQQRVESLLQKGLFDQERLLQDVAIALERLAPPAKDAGES